MTATNNIVAIYVSIALRIILEQENLVGTLAWQEAKHVPGLVVANTTKPEVIITENPKDVIDMLVAKYENLFGKMARDVCKTAVVYLTVDLSPDEVPESLK